jgi:hypothetical protein
LTVMDFISLSLSLPARPLRRGAPCEARPPSGHIGYSRQAT